MDNANIHQTKQAPPFLMQGLFNLFSKSIVVPQHTYGGAEGEEFPTYSVFAVNIHTHTRKN
jgi:hypothetical protein